MERIDIDTYFMNMAKIVSTRSTCIKRQVGAVIVKDKELIATGYNGAVRGLPHCIDLYEECPRIKVGAHRGERYDLCPALHAEQNAIISASRKETIGSDLYMVGINAKTGEVEPNSSSCMMCKRVVINAGINRVIVREPNNEYTIYNVEDWITNDDSLNGKMGY